MSHRKLAVQYTSGLTPLTNCRSLAWVTLSWMRYRTKLAGTNDMAKMTQMATTASTEVVSLKKGDVGELSWAGIKGKHDYLLCSNNDWWTIQENGWKKNDEAEGHSHCDLRELLFGQVQRMVDNCDPVFVQICSFWKICAKDGIVGHVHKRHHGMPALIVIPNLRTTATDYHNVTCIVYFIFDPYLDSLPNCWAVKD